MSSKKNSAYKQLVKPAKEIEKVKRLPSYVVTFDLLTGGGIPLGRFSLFWGDKSTSKTTMALRLASNFLELFPQKVLYLDYEHTFDPLWAGRFIADLDRVDVAQPVFAEEGIELVKEILLDGEYGFLIIDSLAAMIPASEYEQDAAIDTVGAHARVVGRLLKKLLPISSILAQQGQPLTVLLINQQRQSVKSFGGGATKPGGKFQDAIASLEIHFYQDGFKKEDDRPIKQNFKFVVKKNKTGPVPNVVGTYSFWLVDNPPYKKGDPDDINLLLKMLQDYGLIKKDKNKWYLENEVFDKLRDIRDMFQKDKRKKYEYTMKIYDVAPI